MRATFYARVSSDTDEQKNSIISQVDFFKEYIQEKNYRQVNDCGVFFKRDGTAEKTSGYYVDEGYSGAKSAKYRKAFQQMMKDAKAKKFDIIFCKNISRFGRNVQETLKYIGDLRENGIGVYFEDVKINTLDRTDDVKITIFSALAQEESRAKSDSVQFGKMRGYKKGIWGGREPYGYNLKDGKLVINIEEAQIVKEVFDKYLNQAMGLRNIALSLNEKGIPTKSGKTIFDQSLISKILKNHVYTGEIRLHRTQKVDINRNIIKKIPENEQIVLQDESLRIIDDETFKLTQIEKEKRFKKFGNFTYKSVIEQNEHGEEVEVKVRSLQRSETRHSNKHLFSNLLKCGNCGGSLRRKVEKNKNRTFIYWFCRNNDNFGKQKCGFRNLLHEEKLIEYVNKELESLKVNQKKLDFYFKEYIKTNFNTKNITKRIDNISTTINNFKSDREANFTLYSKGIIDEQEYSERNLKISAQLSSLDTHLNQLLYQDNELDNLKLKYSQYKKSLADLDTSELSNAVLRIYINKIVATTFEEHPFGLDDDFEKHTLKIEWNILDTNQSQVLREASMKRREFTRDPISEEEMEELYNRKLEKLIGS